MSLWSFQGARELEAPALHEAAPQLGLGPSKLNSVRPGLERTDTCNEVDVVLGELDHRTTSSKSSGHQRVQQPPE